jgi:hypothetical protein
MSIQVELQNEMLLIFDATHVMELTIAELCQRCTS